MVENQNEWRLYDCLTPENDNEIKEAMIDYSDESVMQAYLKYIDTYIKFLNNNDKT